MPKQTKWGRWVRLLFLLFAGLSLILYAYQLRYHTIMFGSLIVGFLLLIGLPVWIWSLIRAVENFRKVEQFGSFALPLLGLAFVPLFWAVKCNGELFFQKPTLLRVYYDGDSNGTGIDFKTDGTYIFDDFCLGSDFTYGRYQIADSKITMDRDTIDRFGSMRHLEVRWAQPLDKQADWYLLQVDAAGNEIPTTWPCQVVVDNRKK